MERIKFATPDLTSKELDQIAEAVESRWITNGPKVREFETKIAKMSRCDRAVAFDSCTGAMEMSLRVLGVGPGDQVITTPFTYSATAEVIRNVGAEIVFVDLDGKSFEMDYQKVADAITEKTKAVMPVDYGGLLCDYDAIYAAIESKKELFRPNGTLQEALGRVAVIADAAHSFNAVRGMKVTGEFADFTCYSFHVLKNITTGGEGGAVAWRNFHGISAEDNEDIELTFRLLGDHGQTSRDKSRGWEYDIALFGYNSIMTDVDAAMGLAQLDRFTELLRRRRRVTQRYDELFGIFHVPDMAYPLIRHIDIVHRSMSAMHLYPIRLPAHIDPESGRDEVFFKLKDFGIPCNVHYKPLPMMTAYKNIGFRIEDYPNAYDMYSRLLTIPYHTELTEMQQEYIVRRIRKAVRE